MLTCIVQYVVLIFLVWEIESLIFFPGTGESKNFLSRKKKIRKLQNFPLVFQSFNVAWEKLQLYSMTYYVINIKHTIFANLHYDPWYFWPTRPRPNRWSLFWCMVPVRPSHKQKRATTLTSMPKSTTYWLGPSGSLWSLLLLLSLKFVIIILLSRHWTFCICSKQ